MDQESEISKVFKPTIISKELYSDVTDFERLLGDYRHAVILDLLESQKKELFKIRNPAVRLTASQLDEIYQAWAADKNVSLEGTWVYYPWSNRLLHILDEDEFIELRTSRNQYKITPAEQSLLAAKTIGIIGLSVGNAVALSIATERACGHLRLADFDTIELSNLNRIRTGIHNTGINKCVVTAREIAEIDPYLHTECFTDGITAENIHDFLQKDGQLDILVDECDDMEVKILCRQVARELSIPVVMETSDRGMLDVERFDLEPGRTILHGILDDIPAEKLRNIAPAERLPIAMKIINAPNTSRRGRLSLLEVGQSIGTWPQLASAVALGGGVVADVCRRILLGQFTDSGRYYVDLEQIIGNKAVTPAFTPVNLHAPFDIRAAVRIAGSLSGDVGRRVPEDTIRHIVAQAGTGNFLSDGTQSWRWIFHEGRLHLFHDRQRSFSFANYEDRQAALVLGAVCQNVMEASEKLGYQTIAEPFPLPDHAELAASIRFSENQAAALKTDNLPDQIASEDQLLILLQQELANTGESDIQFVTNPDTIRQLALLVGECDLIMQVNPWGHHDLFHENDTPGEPGGGNILTHAGPVRRMALSILRDNKVAETMRQIGAGGLLVQTRAAELLNAALLVAVTLKSPGPTGAFQAGMLAQKLSSTASRYGFSVEPLLSPALLFGRLRTGEGLDHQEQQRLLRIEDTYKQIIVSDAHPSDTFLFKIAKTESPEAPLRHLPLDEVLFLVNEEI